MVMDKQTPTQIATKLMEMYKLFGNVDTEIHNKMQIEIETHKYDWENELEFLNKAYLDGEECEDCVASYNMIQRRISVAYINATKNFRRR